MSLPLLILTVGNPLIMFGLYYFPLQSLFTVFYMSSLRFEIEAKRNIKISLKKSPINCGDVIVPIRKDLFHITTQYFHGSFQAAELSIRGWALIQNFAPWNPRTVKIHDGFQSPAECFNKFRYHNNWLQNLLISASLGGARSPPQNPL